jgi:hypothetical protein
MLIFVLVLVLENAAKLSITRRTDEKNFRPPQNLGVINSDAGLRRPGGT